MPDPTRQLVIDAIVAFGWSNYGLDEVDNADPEYADALAGEVLEALAAYFDEPKGPTA